MLLGMFLLTQFIGLGVVNSYSTSINPITGEEIRNDLPFNLDPPEEEPEKNFVSLIIAFMFAFFLIFVLMKYKWKFIIRAWFFFVVALALGIVFYIFFRNSFANPTLLTLIFAVPLAYLKIFRPNVWVHNITELLIYPGIAAVFVPILSVYSAIILLILISLYDMWAVWHSGIMQKMAKFQMEELNLFGGFLLPSASSKVKKQIKNLKQKYKGKKIPKKIREKKFKVSLAILGGGDVIFPIITAGVFLRAFDIVPALFVLFGSLLGLTYLFAITEKDKAYPAMPYITAGIFVGLLAWVLFVL